MKKILLSLVAVFTLATANAQEEKATKKAAGFEGTWWVAGGLSVKDGASATAGTSLSQTLSQTLGAALGGTTTPTTASALTGTTFKVSPTVGTFITDDITVGLGLNFTFFSPDLEGAESTTTFGVTPLVRKYWSINDKFFIYGQADLPLDFDSDKVVTSVNIRPGIDYFVAKNFSIEASFGVIGYDVAGESFKFDIDSSSLNFGFKYLF